MGGGRGRRGGRPAGVGEDFRRIKDQKETAEAEKGGEMKTAEYKCDECGRVFLAIRPDEEAVKEFEANFPGHDISEAARVCDDCYTKNQHHYLSGSPDRN